MISLLVEILLICAIVIAASYILENLLIAFIVCCAFIAFLSKLGKKKPKTTKCSKHDICKQNIKEVLRDNT